MKSKKKFKIFTAALIVIAILTLVVLNQQKKQLILGTLMPTQPYLMETGDSGLEFDIINKALKAKGYKLKKVNFININQVSSALTQKSIHGFIKDAGLAIKTQAETYASNTTLEYIDYAISLAKNNLNIKSINDLLGKRVLAFGGAKNTLGPAFKAMAENNSEYRETSEQSTQISELYANAADVIISDKNIFLYFEGKSGQEGDVVFHNIFPKTPRHVIFSDKKVRDNFNEGLQ